MTTYKIGSEPNQEFFIDNNGEKIKIKLRYIPLNKGWYASIEDVVNGVKVSLGLPIFAGYGYKNIFFIKENDAVDWLGEMDSVYLAVLTTEEIESVLNPVLVYEYNGVNIV